LIHPDPFPEPRLGLVRKQLNPLVQMRTNQLALLKEDKAKPWWSPPLRLAIHLWRVVDSFSVLDLATPGRLL